MQLHMEHSYLHYRHTGADIDQQVGENVRLCRLEAELGVCVLGVNEGLVWDVPQHKVTTFNQAGHLVLFVHTAGKGAMKLFVSAYQLI